MRLTTCGVLAVATVLAGCQRPAPLDYSGPVAGWASWGGSEAGLRYSPLTQITPENVSRLEIAWTYHTGTLRNPEPMQFPTLETTPVLGEGRLYLCSPLNRVIALDPETGRELWTYDPRVNLKGIYLQQCRGVTFHEDTSAPAGAQCRSRVLTGTLDARLIALDAATGKPCEGFGEHGTVDLRAGLGEVQPGEYIMTSPPVVAAGRIILGGHVVDNLKVDVPAGVVRAFDLHTGELALGVELAATGSRGSEDRRRERHLRARHGECLVGVLGRSRARLGLRAHGQHRARSLRRPAQGARLLLELARGPRGSHGPGRLALPDRASRSLGLRRACTAGALRFSRTQRPRAGRRPGDEARPHLHPQPGDG